MKISTITPCILKEPFEADEIATPFDNTVNIPYSEGMGISSGESTNSQVIQISFYILLIFTRASV